MSKSATRTAHSAPKTTISGFPPKIITKVGDQNVIAYPTGKNKRHGIATYMYTDPETGAQKRLKLSPGGLQQLAA